jgi:hypothetical protein
MLTPRKWNGDSRPFIKKGPIPKGDPRDRTNAHNRSLAKREIREELKKLESDKIDDEIEYLSFFDCEGL